MNSECSSHQHSLGLCALNVEVEECDRYECDRYECYALDDFNTISISRAVSSLGSCGSLIYHDFNTISTTRAVSSQGSCGSLIYIVHIHVVSYCLYIQIDAERQ